MGDNAGHEMRQSFETWLVLALGLSVGLAGVGVLGAGGVTRDPPIVPPPPKLEPVSPDSAKALEHTFEQADYGWPPSSGASVPRLAVTALPDDLADRAVKHKKTLFLRSLLPLVLAENRIIRHERRFLKRYFDDGDFRPGAWATRRAKLIAERFGIRGDLSEHSIQTKLLRRVDEVPPALALAQAAIESGWGTSRFALQGNSLFGQWTWRGDQGLTPSARPEGARHSVRAFPNLRASVRAYFHNLNTFHAYAKFRTLRAAMRRAGKPLDPLALTVGLDRYSQRRDEYVTEVKAMIESNRLATHLRDVHLAEAETEAEASAEP